jgi:hypothetical protein
VNYSLRFYLFDPISLSWQAIYSSTYGGDNFAVGAVMHDSPVGRRDSPAAMDEKQLVSLEAAPRYELHNVSSSHFC